MPTTNRFSASDNKTPKNDLCVFEQKRIPDKTRKGKSVGGGFYFTFEWKVDSGGTGAKKLDHCYHHQVFGSSIPTLGDELVRE